MGDMFNVHEANYNNTCWVPSPFGDAVNRGIEVAPGIWAIFDTFNYFSLVTTRRASVSVDTIIVDVTKGCEQMLPGFDNRQLEADENAIHVKTSCHFVSTDYGMSGDIQYKFFWL